MIVSILFASFAAIAARFARHSSTLVISSVRRNLLNFDASAILKKMRCS